MAPSGSASTIVSYIVNGYHILKIDGYSRTLTTATGEYLVSLPFTVGGYRCLIRYYPNGVNSEAKDYISIYLHVENRFVRPQMVQYKFCIVGDEADQPFRIGTLLNVNDDSTGWGLPTFIKREYFKASKHLQDDSFAIRCDVVFPNEFRVKAAPEATDVAATISLPPSDLQQHFGSLLRTKKHADVVFDVFGVTFAAHRCVLAARCPILSAELFGGMKDSFTRCVVHIKDMEPWVFKSLLYFIYTDSCPKLETKREGEERDDDDSDSDSDSDSDDSVFPIDVLCEHLLVVAEKYHLKRLKLLCESKLCEYIDVGMVGTILVLAEQHHCPELKKLCFNFLSSPANFWKAFASDGFKRLSTSCPSVMQELFAMRGSSVP